MWSHSYKSFTLLDSPLAELYIPPTFDGFDQPEVECSIPKVHHISQKGNIYQLNLTKAEGAPFQYLKYRYLTQLGRYYAVTLNRKVTRLYTTVNFLVQENTSFLEGHLRLYRNWAQRQEGGGSSSSIGKGTGDVNKSKSIREEPVNPANPSSERMQIVKTPPMEE